MEVLLSLYTPDHFLLLNSMTCAVLCCVVCLACSLLFLFSDDDDDVMYADEEYIR